MRKSIIVLEIQNHDKKSMVYNALKQDFNDNITVTVLSRLESSVTTIGNIWDTDSQSMKKSPADFDDAINLIHKFSKALKQIEAPDIIMFDSLGLTATRIERKRIMDAFSIAWSMTCPYRAMYIIGPESFKDTISTYMKQFPNLLYTYHNLFVGKISSIMEQDNQPATCLK